MKKFFLLLTLSVAEIIKPVIVISFGQACTVAGALRELGLRKIAYPFDWMVSPFDSLYRALDDNFEHFLDEDSLMVRNDNWGILDYYGFHFVHDFPTLKQDIPTLDSRIDEHHMTGGDLKADWKSSLPAVKEKYQRRIERLRCALEGSERVLLIRHFDTTLAQAMLLRDLLRRKYPRLDFTLVVVGKHINHDWNIDGIKGFYLDESILDPEQKQWRNIFITLGLGV